MDRRKSIKSIILGSVAGGLAVHGCKPEGAAIEEETVSTDEKYFGRTPEELELIEKLNAEQFFNEHELETIDVLSNLILPPNENGGPTEAGVPEFIEFMAKDIPELQTTLRGGLMWLDHKSNTDFGTEFKLTEEAKQKQILDPIAFYDAEVPMDEQALEIQFFSLMRNLTLTGYYTSKMGIEDLGYKGNMPNVWDGVPQDVLDQHGVAYEEEWLAKCVDQSKRGVIAEWDENGNLLT
ncbi:gluconate 2-dehydrogenase subunit 3 family protein [Poritiphilus flavus]|uniref:Gluconate 2-dehydrogenase subunit 3 family protein n=1 Tax=Poritiphilus flavus TaxID=2697053 RepID=A0A6L9EC68_9FLAO|nr:gluconate 2-dehydrogenase subunit 3 family protein [Poritiphilus flavus]NAS12325.1 gluconate 2-dehydrogenase subunit 3 family protein [Poritiphilus flavus]